MYYAFSYSPFGTLSAPWIHGKFPSPITVPTGALESSRNCDGNGSEKVVFASKELEVEARCALHVQGAGASDEETIPSETRSSDLLLRSIVLI